MSADPRVQLAREYLAAARQHKVDILPPSVLVRECAELRRQLGKVLDAIGQAEAVDVAGQLISLATWMDDQLASETASRQYIAEGASDRIRELCLQLLAGAATITAADLPTVIGALADATTLHQERAEAYCADCVVHPAGACEEHLDDLDQAEAYKALARMLGADL